MRFLPIALTLALPAIAGAQGLLIPRCVTPRPGIERPIDDCRPDRPAIVRTASNDRVELRDRVLRYEVEERFLNRGGLIGEADYIFPLPKGAAFRDLKLSIDGQLVAGETMSATEARRIYEDIVRRQKDPALVEWMGHGMLRTRIFPIQAGEERRVVVRFESVAEREGDAVRVDYFTGSRPDGLRVTGDRLQSSEQPATRNPQPRTSFSLTYRAGGELGEAYSPTHELDVDRDDAQRRVSIRGGSADVTVLVALRRSLAASVATLTHATRDEEGYALITVTPPTDLASNRLPRDLTFVLDVSGSMAGRKMEQAKAAGRALLRTLTDRDRFRIVDFSTDVRSFRDGFTAATQENIRAGIRYLDGLDATGSTNISGALEEALRQSESESERRGRGRMPIVLFMTDGAATVGERDPVRIAANAARMRGDARIFTYGLGADLNIGLVEQLAVEGRGIATFLRPDESVERSVELLATRLRAPILTDVRVRIDGNVRLSRVYPSGPQDVFAGQDLVFLARYDGNGPANVIVTGRSGEREVRWSNERNFAREERDNAFVPRLWATQRIGWLAAEKRRNGGNTEIDDEIRRLGERFGIPTEFTSYLVLEPGMVAGNLGGVRRDAVGTSAANGPVDVRLRRASGGSGAPAAAPAPQVAAFEAAKSASEQRQARSIAAADMMRDEAAASGEIRTAGAKMFRKDGETWTDLSAKPNVKVYKVAAYSKSYFALLEKLPQLKESLAVAEKVKVAGKSVAIEIVDSAAELSDREIEDVVRLW